MFFRRRHLAPLGIGLALLAASIAPFRPGIGLPPAAAGGPLPSVPILFVTQVPVPADFTTIGAVFGNHRAALDSVTRGGDLWIRYSDGTLKNLTAAAGYGDAGMQGANAIAVRDPSVHWNGAKAVFSMVIGAPTKRYDVSGVYRWQLYEITGIGQNETPVITKVPNQPAGFNNVSPIYGTNGRIIFTTDRPRNGQAHLYPQLDEYELAPTNTGLWSLDPATGDLFLMNHTPSGAFTPSIDSYGRVIFTRWDHLQRDQQADADALGKGGYGTFNYSDESAAATKLADRTEVFPEPRATRKDLLAGTNLAGHSFNLFQPWQITEAGTEEETLNHVGRHELDQYIAVSLTDDPALVESYRSTHANANRLNGMLQIKEDPKRPGVYYGVDAPEFATHAAGQIVTLTGQPGLSPDQMLVEYVTHRDTSSPTAEGATPSAPHSGLYREPLPLSDGVLVAVHTAETRVDRNTGTTATPGSRYDFRLKTLVKSGSYHVPDQPLTPGTGIVETVSYWTPDELATYSGPLWELNPVEVRARTVPGQSAYGLAGPEKQILTESGVDLQQLQAYLRQNDLALIVSRNVTTRDDSDRQQPFNLRVAGTNTQSSAGSGKVYDVTYLQLFQADQLRGWTGYGSTVRPGRRVLAQPLHDPAAQNPATPAGAPPGSVSVAADGSVAAFVPARRAMTWQLTDGQGQGVVRERYWVTFQPGEVRVCTSCHGLNGTDQAGKSEPVNPPAALAQILSFWKASGGAATPVETATATPATDPAASATPVPATATGTASPTAPVASPTGTAAPATPSPTGSPATATATPIAPTVTPAATGTVAPPSPTRTPEAETPAPSTPTATATAGSATSTPVTVTASPAGTATGANRLFVPSAYRGAAAPNGGW